MKALKTNVFKIKQGIVRMSNGFKFNFLRFIDTLLLICVYFC